MPDFCKKKKSFSCFSETTLLLVAKTDFEDATLAAMAVDYKEDFYTFALKVAQKEYIKLYFL